MLAILLLAVATVLSPFVRSFIEQQGRISALEDDIASREKALGELQIQDARWNDPAYIAAQARKRFTYVMSGEVGYVVLDTPRVVEDEADPSGAAAREVADSTGSWASTLWDSVEAAGAAPADPAGSTNP